MIHGVRSAFRLPLGWTFLWPLLSVLSFGPVGEPLAAQGGGTPDQFLDLNSVVSGETPRWAPDGSHIIFRSSLAGGGLLAVDPQGGFPTRIPVVMGSAGHFLASQSPQYSPDGLWISFVSDKSGHPEVWLWSSADGSERQLTDLRPVGINSYSWSPDGRHLVLAANLYGVHDIFRVQVANGEVTRVTSGNVQEVYPTFSPDSRRILYVELDDRWVDHDIHSVDLAGGDRRLVAVDRDYFDYGAGSEVGYPMVSPDGSWVLFRSYRSGWRNYWLAPMDGASEPRPLALEEADQDGAMWSPDGRAVVYTSNRNGTHSLRVASVSDGRVRVLVDPEQGRARLPSWSPDGRQISYVFGTLTAPDDLFVIPAEGGQARRLTNSMPLGTDRARLVQPEKVMYASGDGLMIPAYLYRPPGMRAGERYPAIVWGHGGPASQYHDALDQEVQFFVNQGYVALLPNFRGGSGYGREFEDANYQCWGHCDLADIVAGVEYLQSLPYVDPTSFGITGSSYGGFLSCAAVTFAPEVFQAAIPRSGYCNRVGFFEDGEVRHLLQLEHNFGPFEENEEVYYRNSPFFFIENIRTPTFLIHGEGRFPESPQFRQFADEMQRLYKPVRYKVFQGENYYVSSRANVREKWGDMLEFFDHYLKGLSPEARLMTHTDR